LDQLKDFLPAYGPGGYVESRPLLSDARFRYLWRRHGAAFVENGAVLKIGGVLYVHPAKADALLLQIFRDEAARSVPA